MTKSSDPFDTPMVFFRVGWMDRYRGITTNDKITGGGAYIKEHGYGHEILNYKPFQGNLYGWVMPGRSQATGDLAKVNLKRISATKSEESLSPVIVVWVSTSPEGGSYVVGWYRNATVFRHPQDPPLGSQREYQGEKIGYVATAKESDSILLRKDERVIQVEGRGKGCFGQSNMWYADDRSSQVQRELRQKILNSIEDRSLPPGKRRRVRPLAKQHNVQLRQLVEKAAIESVTKHYVELGYEVKSVERDNVGWDLEATLDKRKLKLEVKGLSGESIAVELTPNEYEKMNGNQEVYRLCIVSLALKTPMLNIFGYNKECGHWLSAIRPRTEKARVGIC